MTSVRSDTFRVAAEGGGEDHAFDAQAQDGGEEETDDTHQAMDATSLFWYVLKFFENFCAGVGLHLDEPKNGMFDF